jgi:hypothetical protein
MMLEVTIGDAICVRMEDDSLSVNGIVPEQFEEYLVRMGRQALRVYSDIDAPAPTPSIEGDGGEAD